MSSAASAAKLAANLANAQHSTGPRTTEGKAISSQNAAKSGLFTTRDFIRPGEESIYAETVESLQRSLVPVGDLECCLVDEIRRAMWRLRRCGETEAGMLEQCVAAVAGQDAPVPDALQNEATAKLQLAVDRARAQCHRLLHKCTAELRKLQSDRIFRREEFKKRDDSFMGLGDLRVVRKSMDETNIGILREHKIKGIEYQGELMKEYSRLMSEEDFGDDAKQTHAALANLNVPARNSRCACGSGRKYKHCCALKAAA